VKVLVTGGAGFIGSFLAEKLLQKGFEVKILDNFSTGTLKNLSNIQDQVEIVRGDIRSPQDLEKAINGVDAVFHFAANPEVRIGDPGEHFEHNILATYLLLETMRKKNVKDIVFASSSTVYGDAQKLPTPEDSTLKPISVYGASKLACESLISSYAHTYGFKGVALRYANVVGPRATRGVIKDFILKLKANPRELEILGDGTQTKSYIWIDDAVDATIFAWEKTKEGFEPYNVGSIDAISVKEVADIVVEVMGLRDVSYRFTGGVMGGRGWVGDVKYMHLDIAKLQRMGWSPKYSSREAVRKAAMSLVREIGTK
jgi:UDP-glucose 4-epimerase